MHSSFYHQPKENHQYTKSSENPYLILKKKKKKEKTGFIIFVNILDAQEIPIGK